MLAELICESLLRFGGIGSMEGEGMQMDFLDQLF